MKADQARKLMKGRHKREYGRIKKFSICEIKDAALAGNNSVLLYKPIDDMHYQDLFRHLIKLGYVLSNQIDEYGSHKIIVTW